MNLDPRAKRLLDMLALGSDPLAGRLGIIARRDGLAKLMAMGAKPVGIARSEDMTIAGPGGPLRLRIYDGHADRHIPAPAIVFCHGGGLVAGSLDTHDGICRTLANCSGAIVIAVEYRLAPEHRFPASLEDASFAVDWVALNAANLNIDATKLVIAGESAGCILAGLIANGFEPVEAKLKAQLALCPVIDLAGTYPSRSEFGQGYLIDAATVQRDIEDCIGKDKTAHGIPSPLRMGTHGRTPATIILSAACDPFRDEAKHYAHLLSAAGVSVHHTCHPGMIHSFYGLNAIFPQAEPALRTAAEQLMAHIE